MPDKIFEEEIVCGGPLLQIVADANAIIAEILRLNSFIPDAFKLESKQDQQKYANIICDFSYFKIGPAFEKKIEDNEELQDLDSELHDNFICVISRFYMLFESIYLLSNNFKIFLNDLNNGHYLQETIESVLQTSEGKQLLCESLYLNGVILLVLDMQIPGIVRERLLVSYYRYSVQSTQNSSNIDSVCKLLRSTGYASNLKQTSVYIQDFFKRLEIDQNYIELILGRLRYDDVYNQITVYPLAEHRSTALANQASMIFICLFFCPRTLENDYSRMREIVDKFFSDNWMITIYMGITVNLIDAWDCFKAAKSALQTVIESENVKKITQYHKQNYNRLILETKQILKEGMLTVENVVANITKIINLIRDCNVYLRFAMLHTTEAIYTISRNKKCKQVSDQVILHLEFVPSKVFELLLNTSQLEIKIRNIVKTVLTDKENQWDQYKNEASVRCTELSNVFSGEIILIKVEKNENIKTWLLDIQKEILSLNLTAVSVSGKKITQLIQAFEEVQEFHNLGSHVQVKQHLTEIKKYLHQMIEIINIKEDILINIQLIGDISYAWRIIDNYTECMQDSIRNQPSLIIKLRSTFLKLVSALEFPLLRINQSHSPDLMSVSQYYSSVLVHYVRKVVQVIPQTICEILTQIINLQTDAVKELPTRLEKQKLNDYAQLDTRYEVAKLTYSISVFTDGILTMQRTLVGIIEIDPKHLLEDGIRKELVEKLSLALHNGLIFNHKSKQSELVPKLIDLSKILDGYKRSFEYVQDYLNINGLRMWQEEITRITNYNVEKECNGFLRRKVQDWQSKYQSNIIPIPVFQQINDQTDAINFIGRLGKEILKQTDPKYTVYLPSSREWVNQKTNNESLNMRIFSKIIDSICPAIIVGLDKFYSHMLVDELTKYIMSLHKNIITQKSWSDVFDSMLVEINNRDAILSNPYKLYEISGQKCNKIWPQFLQWTINIGLKQIIREHIINELNLNCKFNSKNLETNLTSVNQSLMNNIKSNDIVWDKVSPQFIHDINNCLEWAGMIKPFQTVYVKTNVNHSHFALFLCLFFVTHSSKVQIIKNHHDFRQLKRGTNEFIDGNLFIAGIATVLRQFNKDITIIFIEYVCQYILSCVHYNIRVKKQIGLDVHHILQILLNLCIVTGIPKHVIKKRIPECICDYSDYIATIKV